MANAVQDGIVSMRRMERLLGYSRKSLFDVAERAPTLYRPFDLRKPGKGWRHIDNPALELKRVQTRIQRRLLRRMALPPTILGGVVGRSIRDNAEYHVGAPVMVTLDLANCFQSISHERVFDALRRRDFSTQVAGLLTQLTTHEGAVPQGAPTSTMVANLALVPLHDALLKIALRNGLVLTFWVDDIAFSGPHADRVFEVAIKTIGEHGFRVRANREKKKIMRPGSKHWLTGTCIDRKVSAGRNRIERIRDEIMDLSVSTHVLSGDIERVRGMIANVWNINSRQGIVLAAFADRKLPVDCQEGRRGRRDETRPCKGRKYHRDD